MKRFLIQYCIFTVQKWLCTQSILQLSNFLEKIIVASLKCVHINPTKKYRKLFFKKTDLLNLLQYCICIEFYSPIGGLSLDWKNLYSFQESTHTVLSTNFLKNELTHRFNKEALQICALLKETFPWIGLCTPHWFQIF